ncbi:MAG: Rieske 2Fe-2S domain-containing protein [Pirellulales bacterium]|nr:Rieske 2Fe-2S domain-containing protein [Pirellulales bacterium]
MTPPTDSRRGFLGRAIALLAGGTALLAPAVWGSIAFLNPLRLKGRSGGFRRLASLDQLPEDGTPLRLTILDERTDAWTRYPIDAVGAVFVRRTGKDRVEALQVTCPHLGCSIVYQAAPGGGAFLCPCHQAHFDLNGKRIDLPSQSPRDMDALEVEIRNRNEVWVKYQTFASGTAKKIATS